MTQTKKIPPKQTIRAKRPYGGRPSLEEAERLHDRILDAAAQLFTRRGYGETSIEAIAAHAGIGKLTLYRRFGDKDTLFQAVANRMAGQARAEIAKLADSEERASDVLIAVGRQVLGIVLSPPSVAFHRILFAEAARLPELCASIHQGIASDPEDPVRRIFRRLVDQRALRVDDAVFLAHQFMQAIIGRPLRNALLGAPPMSARAQAEHVRKAVDLFLHGASEPASR